MHKNIYLLGLNHRTASVEIREKFALAECEKAENPPFPPADRINETMVLSTCNRVEMLVVGKGAEAREQALAQWARFRGATPEELRPYLYVHEGLDAVRHLFRVACSLDSMVLGEPQILGQLKKAYGRAVIHNSTGVILNRLLHKAFSVAKRVRTETQIGSSAVSISYAAVELAKRIFGDMKHYKAMLIGAGEMAELAALHLLAAGIQHIVVANRTYERAVDLATQFKGSPIPFDSLFNHLAEVDIIISSTGSPTAVIKARDIKGVLKKRKNRPMFFIDIAVPRDIDPDVNNLDNVYLYDIDDLKEVVEENLSQRKEEADRARAIVECEADEFQRWLKSLELQPTIVDLLTKGDAVAHKELAKTLKRLGAEHDPEIREALEVLVHSLVRKMLHEPISFLKRRSAEEEPSQRFIDITRRMFNLDNDPEHPEAHLSRKNPSLDPSPLADDPSNDTQDLC